MLDRFLFVRRICGAFVLILLIFCSTVSMARGESDEEYWGTVNPVGTSAAVYWPEIRVRS